ncbi:MAG TPA: Fic/DOC family N-terminal domain-containing protein [Anaerohalosphaeraceae bacterium]|nr:Fic/DOC family N-terminal domain-containing protein [Anaerohalosphaeraceae bacterium]HRT24866.1 Fic/DOC family N-terminal domain-containing protein [Anaerohalosphaeraceae bacterium]
MSKPVFYHYGRFPPKKIQWEKLISWIGPATGALTRYDGILSVIPNPSVLLSPLTTQEAVLSSKIEGTQTTMGEVLEYEAEKGENTFSPEKKEDIYEVLNYRRAIWKAIKLLETLPLCSRVICEAHQVLMDHVRGHNKLPGHYRKTQNWIGPHGCPIEQAHFIPIAPDKLIESIGLWEKYIHQQPKDKLVQLAILHAEFEALHPFLDGNGRMGRMFIPLFLYKVGLIQSPMFYISAYFEANRDEYYERLLAVSRDDDWTGWCLFFLKAIEFQARENQKKATQILKLYEQKKSQIHKLTRSQYTLHTLDFIFEHPIFKATKLTKSGKVPAPSAKKILSALRNANIIKTLKEASGRRAAVFVFPELLNTAEGKEIF